jgi:hypothetical protein
MSITVTKRPNAELVRRVYEAFNTGDLDALTALLSPDVSFLQPGRSTVSGLYKGRDAVFGWFGALAAATDGTFRAELLDLVVVADLIRDGWRHWIDSDEASIGLGLVPDRFVAHRRDWIELMREDAGRNLGFTRLVAEKR